MKVALLDTDCILCDNKHKNSLILIPMEVTYERSECCYRWFSYKTQFR